MRHPWSKDDCTEADWDAFECNLRAFIDSTNKLKTLSAEERARYTEIYESPNLPNTAWIKPTYKNRIKRIIKYLDADGLYKHTIVMDDGSEHPAQKFGPCIEPIPYDKFYNEENSNT